MHLVFENGDLARRHGEFEIKITGDLMRDERNEHDDKDQCVDPEEHR